MSPRNTRMVRIIWNRSKYSSDPICIEMASLEAQYVRSYAGKWQVVETCFSGAREFRGSCPGSNLRGPRRTNYRVFFCVSDQEQKAKAWELVHFLGFASNSESLSIFVEASYVISFFYTRTFADLWTCGAIRIPL